MGVLKVIVVTALLATQAAELPPPMVDRVCHLAGGPLSDLLVQRLAGRPDHQK